MSDKQQDGGQLRRGLKSRHLSMIAIGGALGTGLFVASGSTIATAGPGGALVAYIAVGIMVYFLMTSLGEMASYMPVAGSFISAKLVRAQAYSLRLLKKRSQPLQGQVPAIFASGRSLTSRDCDEAKGKQGPKISTVLVT